MKWGFMKHASCDGWERGLAQAGAWYIFWRVMPHYATEEQVRRTGCDMGAGMDQARLAEVQETIRADIRAGLYHGAVIKVARGGKVALEAAIGAADADQQQPLALDSVFNIFSVTPCAKVA
jgi:CubicO group peptidase (beta-lactamase class C family)